MQKMKQCKNRLKKEPKLCAKMCAIHKILTCYWDIYGIWHLCGKVMRNFGPWKLCPYEKIDGIYLFKVVRNNYENVPDKPWHSFQIKSGVDLMNCFFISCFDVWMTQHPRALCLSTKKHLLVSTEIVYAYDLTKFYIYYSKVTCGHRPNHKTCLFREQNTHFPMEKMHLH